MRSVTHQVLNTIMFYMSFFTSGLNDVYSSL